MAYKYLCHEIEKQKCQSPWYICEMYPPPGNFVHQPIDTEIQLFLGVLFSFHSHNLPRNQEQESV